MLRHPTNEHRGGRTDDLLKVKDFFEEEAIVYGTEKGTGKYKGMIGSLNCRMVNDSKITFKAGSGMNDIDRGKDPSYYIGKTITVCYFEKTNDGNIRFPIYKGIRLEGE